MPATEVRNQSARRAPIEKSPITTLAFNAWCDAPEMVAAQIKASGIADLDRDSVKSSDRFGCVSFTASQLASFRVEDLCRKAGLAVSIELIPGQSPTLDGARLPNARRY